MYLIKIFVTLLLIQSLQLTFAQDEDDLGSIESLPRFEARRQSSLNAKDEFEYDDEDAAPRPVNPLPARTGRNDDDDDFDQSPQREDGASSGDIVPPSAPASVKGQVAPSSAGRLSLPRFPGQQTNSFVAPLPAPIRPTLVPVSVSNPVTFVGKTNLGGDASGALSVPRLVRPNESTKTVRVVKTRVVRPNPVAVDQSGSLSSGVKGGIKSSQVNPTVTRVVRPVLVTRQPQPAFIQPIVQPIAQPVVQPVVRPVPAPVSIATPITSGSSGPNAIISGGVKTVPFVANSKVQPPRLRVITTRRPTIAPVDVDEDEDSSADTRPAQVSGVKTLAAANPVPLVPVARFTPTRTLVQPIRQPSRLEVIYADERLNNQEEDEDDEDGNAARLSQPNIIKVNRPVPVRVAPQPYLVPLNVQGPQPVQPSNVFFQPTIQTQPRPTIVSTGKTNSIKSTFNVRPQPVPVRETVFTPVAPTLVPVAPIVQPAQIDSGSASGSRSVVGVKGGASAISPLSKVQPPRVRVITTQRPTTPVQVFEEDGLASGVSGIKGSGIAGGSRSIVRPVLVRTPPPTVRPLVQVQEEPLPTFQQIDLIRTQPAGRPFVTIQEQTKSLPTVNVVRQPTPQPTVQPIVQIRDGAASAELPLPSPPRPIQIVRVTPAPTVRPITQIRESALPSVQPVQISQPRLVPVAPAQPQVIQISEPARPLTQVRESAIPLFQPLDPALRPAIPTVQVTQVQEAAAPRETVFRQPTRPVQVIQPQAQQQIVQINQVQQPSIVETVQLKESAVPITSSQANLGAQRVSQPQPQPQPQTIQTILTTSQEPASVPAPQSFEILRLQQPQLPIAQRQPQTLVQVRPRLIPAQLPVQTVQSSSSSSLPVARPNIVQISQEKESASLSQQQAPATVATPIFIPQQQRRVVSFPHSVQQIQTNVASVAPVAPITQVSNVQTTITQPRPILIRQPSVPRFIAPLPLPQPDSQPQFAFPLTVQNRLSQPTLVVQQQQRPTIVVSQQQAPATVATPVFIQQQQRQPSPLVIQRQRPVASVAPITPISVQSSLSQPIDQQLVQIREKASSVQDEFSQIEQVRLARA